MKELVSGAVAGTMVITSRVGSQSEAEDHQGRVGRTEDPHGGADNHHGGAGRAGNHGGAGNQGEACGAEDHQRSGGHGRAETWPDHLTVTEQAE